MISSTLRFAIALVLVAQWSHAFEDDPTNLSPDAVQFFETCLQNWPFDFSTILAI